MVCSKGYSNVHLAKSSIATHTFLGREELYRRPALVSPYWIRRSGRCEISDTAQKSISKWSWSNAWANTSWCAFIQDSWLIRSLRMSIVSRRSRSSWDMSIIVASWSWSIYRGPSRQVRRIYLENLPLLWLTDHLKERNRLSLRENPWWIAKPYCCG